MLSARGGRAGAHHVVGSIFRLASHKPNTAGDIHEARHLSLRCAPDHRGGEGRWRQGLYPHFTFWRAIAGCPVSGAGQNLSMPSPPSLPSFSPTALTALTHFLLILTKNENFIRPTRLTHPHRRSGPSNLLRAPNCCHRPHHLPPPPLSLLWTLRVVLGTRILLAPSTATRLTHPHRLSSTSPPARNLVHVTWS